jgi:hypothetical protein
MRARSRSGGNDDARETRFELAERAAGGERAAFGLGRPPDSPAQLRKSRERVDDTHPLRKSHLMSL